MQSDPPVTGVGPQSPISAVMQDYLKIIYSAGEWSTAPVTTKWLAARLEVAASSVSAMIGKLKALDLVDHRPYGSIELTEHGQLLGKAMVRRHRLIETYLVAELGYGWDEVHEEAEILEHAISDLMLNRIDVKLGHPTRDPHGDPIPDRDGQVRMPRAVTLDTLTPGSRGTVARLSDNDSELLRYFDEVGIVLDAVITAGAENRFGGGTALDVATTAGQQTQVTLADQALKSIWVVPDSEPETT
ncbi:metal-dependent transcriptional regulator [Jonesiaceae bacterium BS-20]|uniref:Manganese transport regulator n=1 Tax=Jonesiaceae bacterium BS-20 TaxID=3120821 RepID=A0AAU7DTI1_9MICO